MKGFRQPQQDSRKERLRALEAELKNSQMSLRISQMLQRQLMENMQNMTQDLGRALSLINELQYKLLAIQQVSGVDLVKIAEITDTLRLKDFNEASDKEDAEGGFTPGDVVEADSTVILTSKTQEPDKGIFRSRIKLSESGVKDLIDGFMGRPVGAKILTKLNGVEHEIELLAIRNPPPAPAAEEVPAATEQQTQETTH